MLVTALVHGYHYCIIHKNAPSCSKIYVECSQLVMTMCYSRSTMNLQILLKAKQDTIDKVCRIVKKQLVVTEDTIINRETKFADLRVDSLDTISLLMEMKR